MRLLLCYHPTQHGHWILSEPFAWGWPKVATDWQADGCLRGAGWPLNAMNTGKVFYRLILRFQYEIGLVSFSFGSAPTSRPIG